MGQVRGKGTGAAVTHPSHDHFKPNDNNHVQQNLGNSAAGCIPRLSQEQGRMPCGPNNRLSVMSAHRRLERRGPSRRPDYGLGATPISAATE